MNETEREYELLRDELNVIRLRLASNDEPGWFYTSSFGKVWVTDVPMSNREAERLSES